MNPQEIDEEQRSRDSNEETPVYEAIVCPICGNKDVAFVTEYHKATAAKIILAILLSIIVVMISIAVTERENSGALAACIIIAAILALTSLGLLIHIFITESKTHVQAICRHCGNLWLLN